MSSETWIDVGARVASSIGDWLLPHTNPRVHPSGFTSEQLHFLQDVVKAGITGVAQVFADKLEETDRRISDLESRVEHVQLLLQQVAELKASNAQMRNDLDSLMAIQNRTSVAQNDTSEIAHAGRKNGDIISDRHLKVGNLGTGIDRAQTKVVLKQILNSLGVPNERIVSCAAFESRDGIAMAEVLLDDTVHVPGLMMDLRDAALCRLPNRARKVWADYSRVRPARTPVKLLEIAEREVQIIERESSSDSVITTDKQRCILRVNGVAMGRVVNGLFVFTPLGIDRYSVEQRDLADMVINAS